MPNANSVMSLNRYTVKSIGFELNANYVPNEQHTIKIAPKFERIIHKIDDENFQLTLSVRIATSEENPVPFNVNVAISGDFHLKNWESSENVNLYRLSAPAILFPYLRSIITMVTADSGFPPYIMPIVNIAKLFPD